MPPLAVGPRESFYNFSISNLEVVHPDSLFSSALDVVIPIFMPGSMQIANGEVVANLKRRFPEHRHRRSGASPWLHSSTDHRLLQFPSSRASAVVNSVILGGS